jgi:anti-sigma factor RsiW
MGARMSGRALELIHAEIDGEITGPQKAELGRLLLADPALRELRAGLRRTCDALDALPIETPPADLRASIMESLPASPPRCEDRDVRFRSNGRFGQPLVRYAAAFAGGLIVSALAFQFGLRHEALDAGELAGTIAGVTVDPSRLELRLDEVQGTVRLEGSQTAPVVVSELRSSRPVQVIARLEGEEVRLEGFGVGPEPWEARVQFSRRSNDRPARVEINIVDVASGTVLQATTLRPTVPDQE